MRKHDAYVIDWQWCGWGCGVHDVVYYLATTASDETASDYAHALWLYHHAFGERGRSELRKERLAVPGYASVVHARAVGLHALGVVYRLLVDENPFLYRQRQKGANRCQLRARTAGRSKWLKVLCGPRGVSPAGERESGVPLVLYLPFNARV